MSLRNRLSRLTEGSLFAPSSPVRVPVPVPVPDLALALPPALPPAPPPPSSGTSVLDDLRKRMDAILTRAESKRVLPAVDCPELPFCIEQTEHGPLNVRTLRLSGAHRVGRIPIT